MGVPTWLRGWKRSRSERTSGEVEEGGGVEGVARGKLPTRQPIGSRPLQCLPRSSRHSYSSRVPSPLRLRFFSPKYRSNYFAAYALYLCIYIYISIEEDYLFNFLEKLGIWKFLIGIRAWTKGGVRE